MRFVTQTFEYAGRDLESMSFAGNYHRHILDIFQPFLGQRVVEVGAGTGSFSKLIAERPIAKLTAIEPSPDMFNELERELRTIHGVEVQAVNGFLTDATRTLQTEPPDSFIFVNVFEHIEHDAEEIRRVFGLLPSGGHLCIFVPAMPALFSDFDRSIDHFRRYRLGELKLKCRQAGFSIAYARYFDWLGVLPWWVRFKLLRRRALSPGAVRAYDRFGVPVIKLTESLVAPPLGKNVILVAEKP